MNRKMLHRLGSRAIIEQDNISAKVDFPHTYHEMDVNYGHNRSLKQGRRNQLPSSFLFYKLLESFLDFSQPSFLSDTALGFSGISCKCNRYARVGKINAAKFDCQ